MIVTNLGTGPTGPGAGCLVDKLQEKAPALAAEWAALEDAIVKYEGGCSSCKWSEFGKQLLATPEVQQTTWVKGALQLVQSEMQRKCSGMPDTTTLALYGAGALAALGVIIYFVKH